MTDAIILQSLGLVYIVEERNMHYINTCCTSWICYSTCITYEVAEDQVDERAHDPRYKSHSERRRRPQVRSRFVDSKLGNNTILLEAKVVHSLIDCLLDLLPIGTALNEFIDILHPMSISSLRSRKKISQTSGRYAPPYRVTSLTI